MWLRTHQSSVVRNTTRVTGARQQDAVGAADRFSREMLSLTSGLEGQKEFQGKKVGKGHLRRREEIGRH